MPSCFSGVDWSTFAVSVYALLPHVNVVCTNSADGQTTMTATIPDTITSWVLSAFAINADVGLGVASEPAKVIVL